MPSGEGKSTRDQILTNLGFDLKTISAHYEELTARTRELYREDLKKEFRAGREVTEDQLRMAKITRHDLEMMVKLDRMVEDPEKYFLESREEARKKANKEMWDEIFSPIKKVFGWLRRKDRNDNG